MEACVRYLEYDGHVYDFDGHLSIEEAWFVAKNMANRSCDGNLQTIKAYAKIWISKKRLGCQYDEKVMNVVQYLEKNLGHNN